MYNTTAEACPDRQSRAADWIGGPEFVSESPSEIVEVINTAVTQIPYLNSRVPKHLRQVHESAAAYAIEHPDHTLMTGAEIVAQIFALWTVDPHLTAAGLADRFTKHKVIRWNYKPAEELFNSRTIYTILQEAGTTIRNPEEPDWVKEWLDKYQPVPLGEKSSPAVDPTVFTKVTEPEEPKDGLVRLIQAYLAVSEAYELGDSREIILLEIREHIHRATSAESHHNEEIA